MIHNTAIISKKASVAKSADIGPYSIIHDHVVIYDNVKIGAHSVIGSIPEDKKFKGENSLRTIIENNTFIGNHVTIDHGTINSTRIGANVFICAHSQIAHDTMIEYGVTIGGGTMICGHVHIMYGAYIGANSTVSPNILIGTNAFLTIGSQVAINIFPGTKYAGNQLLLKQVGLNEVGLLRNPINMEIENERFYRLLKTRQ